MSYNDDSEDRTLRKTPVSLRIPEEVRSAIEETVRRSGRDFSAVANEMLAEAVKIRRIPGVVFADGSLGRVARVAGTGLAVYEVVKAHRAMGKEWERLREAFHWLSEQQLRAALGYAAAYPQEIDALLRHEDASTAEAIWSAYPFTRPPWR